MPYQLRTQFLPEKFYEYEHYYEHNQLIVNVPMLYTDDLGNISEITKTFTIDVDDEERWAIAQEKVNTAIFAVIEEEIM
jgi:hypothetical protein